MDQRQCDLRVMVDELTVWIGNPADWMAVHFTRSIGPANPFSQGQNLTLRSLT